MAVALALVIGGIAFANRSADQDSAKPGGSASVMGTATTAAPSQASPSTPATPSPKPSSATVGGRASKALSACQQKVRQADTVLKVARTGVRHWATHVQAQTDEDNNKITTQEMQGKFKQTRLAGPADQKRYADALFDYQELEGSCAAVDGAPDQVADALAKCAQRSQQQRPVLKAAAAGMKDWQSHLAAMQRSAAGHAVNAQAVWIKAWRAAPPHIKAYQQAAAAFDAPNC